MTSEDIAFARLWELYIGNPAVEIHSAHPPSGKSYRTPLVRIARFRHGEHTRERYHIDYILQVGPLLVLQELKGMLSESGSDVGKLRGITTDYTIPSLVRVLERRVANPAILSSISAVTLSLGCIAMDAPVPPDFLVFEAGQTQSTIWAGAEVAEPIVRRVAESLPTAHVRRA